MTMWLQMRLALGRRGQVRRALIACVILAVDSGHALKVSALYMVGSLHRCKIIAVACRSIEHVRVGDERCIPIHPKCAGGRRALNGRPAARSMGKRVRLRSESKGLIWGTSAY